MSQDHFKIGDYVTAIYKTGKYIGEITDVRPNSYLIRVLAVEKHPMQGDLHNPKQVDVAMFHQRRALAFREQTNVPKNMVREYKDEVPDYKASLKAAVQKMKETLLSEDTPWSQKSIEMLEELERDYFK
ncbi:kinase-associated lipoprotein B [Peribacillus tepidiphilus]|uniref:kinase-associated lipoprotein B n=1 Tax=Peribacillus tepidiphilus TaxID=2652445 RepID=UPI0012919218|nr:kinase-associated lipoprotein B [Peribacillus tepidiphilus]